MTEHENAGSLPRFTDIATETLRYVEIVVLHEPRHDGTDVVWTLSLTDRVGRPLGRQTVTVPAAYDYLPHLAAELRLHLVGLTVHGHWYRSRDGRAVRHYARVTSVSQS
ncbi:hypothetical protein [Cellulomonas endometrii]|uniref:hypothetical protein n=1 Tax=Cellulomonas endometrii TaxID=3036301 RepID=UPI0024AE5F39|nr:hypothetical protein [Cellulomonas endometrii]